VDPTGRFAYVMNSGETSNIIPTAGTVSEYTIDSTTGALTAIAGSPVAAGVGAASIAVASPFAGTPGKADCGGKTVSALSARFGNINAAAAALGFPSVKALQDAIKAFCK